MSFQDHFSAVAGDYGRFRPDYPPALFDWLAGSAPGHDLAWDCATGSGQAARPLGRHFRKVVATDASAEQIGQAPPSPKVEYRVEPAERTTLAPRSVDLVTVAQALHWFDLDRFYAEVRRTLKPDGLLAAWTYNRFRVSPPIDAVVDRLYEEILGPWWPPERRHVERGYADLPFPFEPVAAPPFAMRSHWTLPRLAGYLRTWSATRRYREARGEDPVAIIEPELAILWGEGGREVSWPLGLRVGRPRER